MSSMLDCGVTPKIWQCHNRQAKGNERDAYKWVEFERCRTERQDRTKMNRLENRKTEILQAYKSTD